MGFGAFHPRQIPVYSRGKRWNTCELEGIAPVIPSEVDDSCGIRVRYFCGILRLRCAPLRMTIPTLSFRRRAPRDRGRRDYAMMGGCGGRIGKRSRDRRRSSGRANRGGR